MRRIVKILFIFMLFTFFCHPSIALSSIEKTDKTDFDYSNSDTTFGVNSKVTFEGVAQCVFIAYLSNGDHQCFAFLTLLRTKSDESMIGIDDWQHTGEGVLKIIFYHGYYDFDPSTNGVCLDGVGGFCYARGE